MAASRHISVPKTFSSGDVTEWLKRFEICSRANEWDDAMKALKLPTLLEGEALAIWLELSEEEQGNFGRAKEAIIKKMAPMGFASLEEFHQRKLRPGEALPLFVHDLKRLLEQAMPDLDASAREQLLLHQFMAGIPAAVGRQLRTTGDTNKLDATVERARLLMSLDVHEEATAAIQTEGEMKQLKEQISELTEQVAALSAAQSTTGAQRPRTSLRCFGCNGFGHVQRNCPSPARRCFNCGRTGHLARNCQQQGNENGTPVQGRRRPQTTVGPGVNVITVAASESTQRLSKENWWASRWK